MSHKVFIWPVSNPKGMDLLENYIIPFLHSLKISFELPKKEDDRRTMLYALHSYDAVILDGSIEEGHIYHKFLEYIKTSNNVLLVSRTLLPRNVYSYHQCAPPHGELYSNEILFNWLKNTLTSVLGVKHSERGYFEQMKKSLDEQNQLLSDKIGYFVSYRGFAENEALKLKNIISKELNVPVRVVPSGEFAYETECMPVNRMWEVCSRLDREIANAAGIVLLQSEGYFDSFWTCAELLAVLYNHLDGDHFVRNGYITTGQGEYPKINRLKIGANKGELNVSLPSNEQLKEYASLLRLNDPGTMAPEQRRNNSGLPGMFSEIAYKLTGYKSALINSVISDEILVPCFNCRPNHQTSDNIDWSAHLNISRYGFFKVHADQLHSGARVQCTCGLEYKLINKRTPRFLWVPGPLFRPWPESLDVIKEEPIWEIEV